MGNLLTSLYPTPSAEQKRMRVGGGAISPPTPSSEPLFLDEVKAEPASWSEESYCRIFQRFIGLLPDSAGEILKQEQQYPLFKHRTPYALLLN
ncbi:hypothetical protein PHYBOEH_006520 [Phytophthora boehmeriae]|uniref:Uncharacterized protein n=1 Tax=Phytophthora boehmeriae TaxID=109152 RepID=A0A8T1WJQ6_9STRA|nr:hypothetical protein PHYBOEH_006520 [Phytophthora boehmeriae]